MAGTAATCGPCASCNGTSCVANPTQNPPVTCQNPCLVAETGTCDASGHCSGRVNVGASCGVGGTCDQNGDCVFPGGCSSCNSGNPCMDDSCQTGQCKATPNQLCQDACSGLSTGSTCSVGNLSGTCDAIGNCNLCGVLGAGVSCPSGGAVPGTCNRTGQCQGNGNQCGCNTGNSSVCYACVDGTCSDQPLPQPVDTQVQSTTAVGFPPGDVSAVFQVTLLPATQDFSAGYLVENVFTNSYTCDPNGSRVLFTGKFTLSQGAPTVYHDEIGFGFGTATGLPQSSCSFRATQQLLYQPSSNCQAVQVTIQQIDFDITVLKPFTLANVRSCLKGVCTSYSCSNSGSGPSCVLQ